MKICEIAIPISNYWVQELPAGSRILSVVAVENRGPWLFVLVPPADPENAVEHWEFHLVGSGGLVPDGWGECYVGCFQTVLTHRPWFVYAKRREGGAQP